MSPCIPEVRGDIPGDKTGSAASRRKHRRFARIYLYVATLRISNESVV
jgi:hypothetical protein